MCRSIAAGLLFYALICVILYDKKDRVLSISFSV